MPEPANHEFESYTKSNYNFSNNGSENYMDYGFKVAIPPFRLNSQTSLNKMDNNNTYLEASSNNQNIESYYETSATSVQHRGTIVAVLNDVIRKLAEIPVNAS